MGIHYYIKHQMEAKRKQMVKAATVHGLNSKETVRYSQELDHLMNIYRRVTVNNNTPKIAETIS
ncbi:aspartyl-phosphate phosphatase Spo0E family protein [Evansella sp. AB-rgal1]|uniref:aspartyl-phosphate phosphatase Spo0E family protein n=1 Tax=Evansella sp. AB-rgal1 TaxID=3242696 RepID=UPI00359DC0F1